MRSLNYLISNGVDVEKSLELFGDIKVYNETLVEFFDSANTKLTKLSSSKDHLHLCKIIKSILSKYFINLETSSTKKQDIKYLSLFSIACITL